MRARLLALIAALERGPHAFVADSKASRPRTMTRFEANRAVWRATHGLGAIYAPQGATYADAQRAYLGRCFGNPAKGGRK